MTVDSSPRSATPGAPGVAGPSKDALAEFSQPASKELISAVADALERNGVTCNVVASGEEIGRAHV